MKLYLVAFVVLFFSGHRIFAQAETNNWFFGYGAGVSFASGVPVSQPGGMTNSPEGCAVMSDDDGSLLFYSDGRSVWDRRHQLMPNGTDLSGDTIASQSSLIVRIPGSENLFYLFSVGSLENNNPTLSYSVVDIRLNGGFGDIVSGSKNKLLNNSVCEKITAIKHENANDLWIVAHAFNTDEFLVYYVNCRGLNEVPRIQRIGQVVDGQTGNAIGYVKGSTDGKKLAIAHFRGTVELFDFDNRTGNISNSLIIGSNPGNVCQGYSVEFSPDSKLLYVSSLLNCAVGGYEINQYQLDAADVNASKYIITSGTGNPSGALQLAPDEKIYVPFGFTQSLACINAPNVYGPGCAFVQEQVMLSKTVGVGVPNFTSGFLRTIVGKDTSLCSPFEYTLNLNINDVTFLWDDGSSSGSRRFDTQGKYWVNIATAEGCNYSDTLNILVKPGPVVDLGNDTGSCTSDFQILLDTDQQNASLQWQDGSTGNTFTVTSPGIYWVKAEADGCSTTDSINVVQYPTTTFNLGSDTSVCYPGHTLSVEESYTNYLWSSGNTMSSITATSPGIYWAEGTNAFGCVFRDSIVVDFKPSPQFTLGKDTSLCVGTSYLLDVSGVGDRYIWQNNSTGNSFLVEQPGVYFVEVDKDGCKAGDSIRISYVSAPQPNLGSDREICPGQTLSLNAGTTGEWYRWNTGNNSPDLIVDSPGTYRIEVGNDCGVVQDEIIITEGSCKIRMPNAFTPSGTSNNEFRISNGFGLKEYTLQVYNRWGQLIFRTSDPLTGWKGWANGVLQTAGTYIYVVAYVDPVSQTKQVSKGSFLLIR